MGVEPTYAAWEAAVLPMNYSRIVKCIIPERILFCKSKFGTRHESGGTDIKSGIESAQAAGGFPPGACPAAGRCPVVKTAARRFIH